MVKNFRFEEEGVLALSGVPESPEAVDWLHEQGIRAVVSLHPVSDEVQRRMDELGIEWTPLYVEDFTRGVPADFADTLEFIHRRSPEGRSVLLH
jgi:hypothetical protein